MTIDEYLDAVEYIYWDLISGHPVFELESVKKHNEDTIVVVFVKYSILKLPLVSNFNVVLRLEELKNKSAKEFINYLKEQFIKSLEEEK